MSSYRGVARVGTRVAFPMLLRLLALTAAAIMQRLGPPQTVAWLVGSMSLALAAIHLLVDVLKRVLRPGPLLVASEYLITWFAWVLVGIALDSIAIPIGKDGFSLLDVLSVIATLLIFPMIGGYLGSLATRGIMASQQISIGMRVGISKFVRFFLLVIAGLLGLNAVGIDLAALTVFGSALGIDLGFGLQRFTADFVSGFILVADRSIRQGEVIKIPYPQRDLHLPDGWPPRLGNESPAGQCASTGDFDSTCR